MKEKLMILFFVLVSGVSAQELNYMLDTPMNTSTSVTFWPYGWETSLRNKEDNFIFRDALMGTSTFKSEARIVRPSAVKVEYRGRYRALFKVWVRLGSGGWLPARNETTIQLPRDQQKLKAIENVESKLVINSKKLDLTLERLRKLKRTRNSKVRRIKKNNQLRIQGLERRIQSLILAANRMRGRLDKIRCRSLNRATLGKLAPTVFFQEADLTCQDWYQSIYSNESSFPDYIKLLKNQLVSWGQGGMPNPNCVIDSSAAFSPGLQQDIPNCNFEPVTDPVCEYVPEFNKQVPQIPDFSQISRIPDDLACESYFRVFRENSPFDYGRIQQAAVINFEADTCSILPATYEIRAEIAFPNKKWGKLWNTKFNIEGFQRNFENRDKTLGDLYQFISELMSLSPITVEFEQY